MDELIASNHGSGGRQISDLVDHGISINSLCFLVTADNRYILACGFWDNSFRVYCSDTGTTRLTWRDQSGRTTGTTRLTWRDQSGRTTGTTRLTWRDQSGRTTGTTRLTWRDQSGRITGTTRLTWRDQSGRTTGTTRLTWRDQSGRTTGTTRLTWRDQSGRITGTTRLTWRDQSGRTTGTTRLTWRDQSGRTTGTTRLTWRISPVGITGTTSPGEISPVESQAEDSPGPDSVGRTTRLPRDLTWRDQSGRNHRYHETHLGEISPVGINRYHETHLARSGPVEPQVPRDSPGDSSPRRPQVPRDSPGEISPRRTTGTTRLTWRDQSGRTTGTTRLTWRDQSGRTTGTTRLTWRDQSGRTTGRQSQIVFGHWDVVTCLSRSESYIGGDCYVVSGSRDATLLLWYWSGRHHAIGDSASNTWLRSSLSGPSVPHRSKHPNLLPSPSSITPTSTPTPTPSTTPRPPRSDMTEPGVGWEEEEEEKSREEEEEEEEETPSPSSWSLIHQEVVLATVVSVAMAMAGWGDFPAPRAALTGHDHELVCVSVCAELGLVISGAKEGPCLVHTITGDLLRALEGPDGCGAPRLITVSSEGHCIALLLSSDGQHLVTGGDRGVLEVWRACDLQRLYTYPGWCSSLRRPCEISCSCRGPLSLLGAGKSQSEGPAGRTGANGKCSLGGPLVNRALQLVAWSLGPR
ncbi:hypothetical protein CRUP_034209 [Coryphaenoides rupestris]|nr:hypothetical protein CRUP_034209 [Coryphaenoides rupestris]